MIFNLIVIGIVLGLAYAWMVRGFFNAFMHMLCIIAAGALAFATWEPIGYLLLGASPDRGFLSFIGSAAWGISLALPFAIYLLLFRVITDKVVKANVKNATPVDYAGGAVCGLVTGVISAGVFTMSIQSMRVPSDFFGYQPLWYTEDTGTGGGSVVLSDSLWLPADKLTAAIYSGLSVGSMSSGQPLAKWYPNLHTNGMAARFSPGGAGRNTISRDDVRIIGGFQIGSPTDARDTKDLLSFSGSTTAQKYVNVEGEPVSRGYTVGYVLQFEPDAKEQSGSNKGGAQIIVGSGQVALLVENSQGDTQVAYPIAMISEAEGTGGQLGRWRFDSRDVFISSVGGQSQVKMGFEYIVPEGYTPIAMIVRQTRLDIPETVKPLALESANKRDLRVRSGSIFTAGGAAPARTYNDDLAVRIDGTADQQTTGVVQSGRIGEILPSQSARSKVELDAANKIVTGEGKFGPDELSRQGAPSSNLRVDSFLIGSGQSLVQIDVSLDKPISFLNDAARNAPTDAPIALIDQNGNEYQAIGFTYRDRDLFHLRYTPGSTIGGMRDVPPISSARGDQRLVMLFIVTSGVDIERLVIGETTIALFRPALSAE